MNKLFNIRVGDLFFATPYVLTCVPLRRTKQLSTVAASDLIRTLSSYTDSPTLS